MTWGQAALIVLTALPFVACDSLAARWGKFNCWWSFAGMCILAPIGYILFGFLNKTMTLSASSGLVNMAIVTMTILIGIFLFKDDVTTPQKWGLALAVVVVYLLA
jgi:multidrug transporter EmrE-like cation transporter